MTRIAPRTTRMSLYSPGGESATIMGKTWLESESFAYPSGAISAGRRAYATLRSNPHNPITLPYGEQRAVAVGVPDTYFTIPARLRLKGATIAGYVSVDTDSEEITFTPEADPAHCERCSDGEGCKRNN